jgi:hypothetical protein
MGKYDNDPLNPMGFYRSWQFGLLVAFFAVLAVAAWSHS